MKNILIPALLAASLCAASAAHALSLTADYAHNNGKAGSVKAKLNGAGIGISSDPDAANGFYGRFDIMREGKIKANYLELQGGYQRNLYSSQNVYLLGKIGVGYGRLSIKDAKNDNNFITLPVGLEAGYKVNGQFSLYAGAGYKWAFDTTDNTTCRSGKTTDSTGRGTCSKNGGIAFYNDKVGNVRGATANIGLRYNF
ncbi:hypothetical protein V9W64_10770 [Neisseria leonii]|uniref:Porin family protein n=1 Tax=Neisseria leonii TaxID=2995413 RepID=A0A9X4I9V3_9NEIS|nr:hypothetical protein [Neisseria sp. 51.81]MDD9326724.1 porin family protein [Neisseria sp. 51.81]